MNDKVSSSDYKLDSFKWLLVAVLVVVGIYGNSYFATESVLYRMIGVLILAGIAGWIAVQTAKGGAFLTLCLEAKTEIRKVVWPTRAETTQTTMIVVVVVIIVAILLWGLDSSLGWMIAKLIG